MLCSALSHLRVKDHGPPSEAATGLCSRVCSMAVRCRHTGKEVYRLERKNEEGMEFAIADALTSAACHPMWRQRGNAGDDLEAKIRRERNTKRL